VKTILFAMITAFAILSNAQAATWSCNSPSTITCDGISVNVIYLNYSSRRIYFGNTGFTHYFSMGSDSSTWSDDAKAIYSLLLTAKSTGNKVNVYTEANGNYLNVIQVLLTN